MFTMPGVIMADQGAEHYVLDSGDLRPLPKGPNPQALLISEDI